VKSASRLLVPLLALATATAFATGAEAAESECPAPSPIPRDGRNLLTIEQEVAFGDAFHEHLGREAEPDAYLVRVSERLLRHLPPSELPFRVLLSDAPVVNASATAGGRVYVTRKLVAATRSEDELAGVIAHELAHGLAQHSAVRISRALQELLKVDRLGDAEDVREKYHLLLERPERRESAEHRLQAQADRSAIEALARAGYRPEALAEFWDRTLAVHGRTGNWLSDLLGNTRPEMKRLREMLAARAALPPGCGEAPRATSDEFRRWRATVIADDAVPAESVPGLVWKRRLEPPLAPEIAHLRFSPDGRLALAQDEATVVVVSSQTFEPVLEIGAPDGALAAQFTPDSKAVVFHTANLRAEVWDVASRARTSVQEVVRPAPCRQAELSPDGLHLACLDTAGRLTLVGVASGSELLARDRFATGPAAMAFSPDGRYFVAGAPSSDAVGFDLAAGRPLELPPPIRELARISIAFLGPDRLAGIHSRAGSSAIVRFPSGERLRSLTLDSGHRLAASGDGRLLLVRSLVQPVVAVVDVDTDSTVLGNRTTAIDVHGDLMLNEAGDGGLDFRRWKRGARSERVARVELPRRRLGARTAIAASPDLGWLAVSSRRKGGVWNLRTAERSMNLRPFDAAFLEDDSLLADFPAAGTDARALVSVDLRTGGITSSRSLPGEALHLGSTLLRLQREADGRISEVDAHDSATGRQLWSRRLPNALFALVPSVDGSTLGVVRPRELGGVDLEVVDPRTGTLGGRVVVAKGIARHATRGATLLVGDGTGRVIVYALDGGQVKSRLFGQLVAAGPASIVTASTDARRLTLQDAAGRARREMLFPSRVVFARLDPDGERLLVLTADQTAWLVRADLPSENPIPAPTGSGPGMRGAW
jgi:hypothetical protein